MRRVMSLWLPSWPIDRRRLRSGQPSHEPIVLAATVGNRRLVTTADEAAQAMGITPGMTLTDARALHPALAVAPADSVERLAGRGIAGGAAVADTPGGAARSAPAIYRSRRGSSAFVHSLSPGRKPRLRWSPAIFSYRNKPFTIHPWRS